MVSTRCKIIVALELEKASIHYTTITLGKAETENLISNEQLQKFNIALMQSGLELLANKKDILIEKIKNVVIELIHYQDERLKVNFSDHLSLTLNLDYTYLANTFSKSEGNTIEHFIISHKVERIKELIVNDELSLTQISWKMHYCSVAHLSAQFKKVTGLTPSGFKNLKHHNCAELDKV